MIIHHAGSSGFDMLGRPVYHQIIKQPQQREGLNMGPESSQSVADAGNLRIAFASTSTPRVSVDDLLTIFPELAVKGETDREFADKVRLSAELARKEDAYEDLRSRVQSSAEPSLRDAQTAKRFQERGGVDFGVDPDCGA